MRVNGYWLWLALAAPSFAEVGFPGFLDSSQRYLRRTSINTYTCQCPPNPPQYYNLWKVLVEEYDAVGNLNTIVQETWAKAHSCSFDTGPAPNPPVTQTSRTNYRSCPGGTYGNLYVLDNPVGEPVSRPPDPNATTAEDVKQGGKPCEKGMAGYSFHAQLISLNITDTPVSYQPPKGPAMAFTATYNQKEAGLPSVFNFSNLGPNWTHNWLSFVIDDPADQSKNVAVFARGGGTETYLATNPGSGVVFLPNQKSQAQLVRISGTTYEKRFPDGSKEVFSRSDGAIAAPRRIFLTSVVDATGNAATLTYDGQLRLETVSDALGQVTTFSYEMVTDPRKITRVTDPFGRTAVLTYNPSGQLASIQDAIGLQSSFAYGPGNFINSLATPYGTTTFVYGENATSRWLTATDPLGQTEKIEYRDKAPGIAAAETVVPTGLTIANFDLDMYNTFYWDKHAYAQFPNDYTKARITRWMPSYPGLSGLVHSTKNPLESRVFYNYLPGQANSSPQPSLAAPDMRALASRVLKN
jgi:YD repeat-containing protein